MLLQPSKSFIKEANRKSLPTERNIYCQFDPDAEAAAAKDEPGEKIFTDDYDDLA